MNDPAPNPGEATPLAPASAPAAMSPAGADPTPAPTLPPEAGTPALPDAMGEPRRRRRRRRRRKGGPGEAEGGGLAAGDQGPPLQGPPPRPQQPQERLPRPEHQDRRERHGHPQRRDRQYARRESEHHALIAVRSLSTMANGLLEAEGIDFLSRPRFVEIKVEVPLDLKRDGMRSAANAMHEILQRVHEVRAHERALAPGSVYCYFTNSPHSEFSRPTEPRQVFDGYSSTGKPNFTDFVTMAIERKDQGIDKLLAGDDWVLTHVTMGRVLRTQQLAEFGKSSPVYRVLGQVDAGLFPLLGSDKKAAFSFQLLRGTTLEGRPRLRIHPVGACDVMDLVDAEVALILSKFQKRLDQESLRLAGQQASAGAISEADEEAFVLPLLQDFARQLAGNARRAQRRTQHAEERTEQGQRPTNKAYEDAKAATDPDLLWDDVEGTVVVIGPKNRIHVFTPEAKHVTSLVMDGPGVHKRRQQGRWRNAEPEERGGFRMHLRRRLDQPEQAGAAATAPAAPAAAAPPTSSPAN